jgi:hypothetical protein
VRAETLTRALMGAKVQCGTALSSYGRKSKQSWFSIMSRPVDGEMEGLLTACSRMAIRAASRIETCAATATPNSGCVLVHGDGST